MPSKIRGSRWKADLEFRAGDETSRVDEFLEALVELHAKGLLGGRGKGFGIDDGVVRRVGGGETDGALEVTSGMAGVKVT